MFQTIQEGLQPTSRLAVALRGKAAAALAAALAADSLRASAVSVGTSLGLLSQVAVAVALRQ